MKHWSRNDKFAFIGVLLAVVGLASALFGQEIRRGLGLDPPQAGIQASVGGPAPAGQPAIPPPPPIPGIKAAVSEMTVTVTGDGNTITFHPSGVVNPDPSYTVDGDNGTSDFPVGPKQIARIQLKGDGNTVRVEAKIKDRVVVVNGGDGNKVLN